MYIWECTSGPALCVCRPGFVSPASHKEEPSLDDVSPASPDLGHMQMDDTMSFDAELMQFMNTIGSDVLVDCGLLGGEGQ